MRIMVSGASGFVGRRLCAELAAAGHIGAAVSRHPYDGLPAPWSWQERSLTLSSGLQSGGGGVTPDALIHLEVKQHVISPTAADVEEFERVNVGGTQEWLRWCTERAVKRFVHFSTIKAVGDSDRRQDETAQSAPLTPYGRSKRKGEQCVMEWAAADPARTALILRPAVVYGPGNTANIFSMVQAIDRGLFFLAGKNDNVKSIVSLANACAAVSFLITRAQPGTQIYHLVDRESYPVCQLATMIARQLGRSRPPRTLPLPLVRSAALAGDWVKRLTDKNPPLNSARLRALLETTHFSATKLLEAGFVHPQSTEEGLADMIRWYRER